MYLSDSKGANISVFGTEPSTPITNLCYKTELHCENNAENERYYTYLAFVIVGKSI